MSAACDEYNKLWDEWVGLTNPEPVVVTADWLTNCRDRTCIPAPPTA